MTKQHIGVTLALNIPLFVVVTKIDIAPEGKLRETVDDLRKVFQTANLQRNVVIVEDMVRKLGSAGVDRACLPFVICVSLLFPSMPAGASKRMCSVLVETGGLPRVPLQRSNRQRYGLFDLHYVCESLSIRSNDALCRFRQVYRRSRHFCTCYRSTRTGKS